MYNNNLVVFHLETTIENREIIEIAIITIELPTLQIIDIYKSFVYSDNITNKSISINGITFDMIASSNTFSSIYDIIYSKLDNKIWVGHNLIGFDIPVLKKAICKIGKKMPTCVKIIDTLKIVKELELVIDNVKLNTLKTFFNIQIKGSRALEDCLSTYKLLCKISLLCFLTN